MNYKAIAAAIKARQLPEGTLEGTYNNAFLDGGNYQYRQVVLAIAYALKEQDERFVISEFVTECGEVSYGQEN